MLRNLGSKIAPRLTPSAAACLQETHCGIHTSTTQWGVGIPERKIEATDPAGKILFLPWLLEASKQRVSCSAVTSIT
jgi:hypothetical protein